MTCGCHLLYTNDIKAKAQQAIGYVLCGRVRRYVPDCCVEGFFGFWIEGEVAQIVFL
jgi:hypothetical protein